MEQPRTAGEFVVALFAGLDPMWFVNLVAIDPESGQFTHVVTQEGHLWGKKEIALPLSAIDRYENDTVYLKLSRADVGQLPAIPIKRSSRSGKPATERLELVARVFDDMQGADQALDFLHQLQTQEKGTFKIRNAVVLVKDAAGEVSAREVAEQKETRRGRWLGALAGGLVGLAAGPVGALVGALAGLGAGNLAASKHDAGFSQQFLAGLEEHLQPGTSALVVLAEHEWMRPLSEVWASREEVIFQETLSDEIVRRLLAAQATGTASEEGSPPPAADA